MPRDLSPLDELPGLLGDTGGVVLRLPGPPPEHTRRLMGTLGVRIEVTTVVSAQDFTATRDCVTPGCPEAAEAGLTHCRRHADVSELRVRRENGDGLAALERMDAGEPQVQPPEPEVREGWSRKRKTRGEIIAGLRRFREEEGRPPTQADRRPYLASVNATKREFGSWDAAFEALGWEPSPAVGRTAESRARAADTRARVIEWIKEQHRKNGYAPSSRDLDRADPAERPCGSGNVDKLFGNWGNAVVEAGFERPKQGHGGRHRGDLPAVAPPEPTVVVRSNQERRREMVVAWIRDFHNLNSRVPAQRELAGFTVGEVRALFGSFGDAVEAAGLPRPTRGGKKAAERSRPREPAATKPRKGENPPLPEPEAAPEADVDCNAFPDPPRPLADLVIEWEEAAAVLKTASLAYDEAAAAADAAAVTVTNHPAFRELTELAAMLQDDPAPTP